MLSGFGTWVTDANLIDVSTWLRWRRITVFVVTCPFQNEIRHHSILKCVFLHFILPDRKIDFLK